ncbi:MAG TPA: chemotaxis protein CheW [Caulobacteraceae bacterium]|nr:chemotaxis protein CheW [Caulobacteraceae bacterium]
MLASGAKALELISFDVGGQSFCMSIASVREIRGWTKATPVPLAPDFILGVINLRGCVMPVVDLQHLLGLGQADVGARSVIIVIDHDGQTSGLLVDAVQDTLTVDSAALQPIPAMVDTREALAEAVLPHGNRLLTLLAAERLTSCCQANARQLVA